MQRKKEEKEEKEKKAIFQIIFLIYIFFLKDSSVNAFMAHRHAFTAHSKRSFLKHSSKRCLAETGFLQKESSHYNFFLKMYS